MLLIIVNNNNNVVSPLKTLTTRLVLQMVLNKHLSVHPQKCTHLKWANCHLQYQCQYFSMSNLTPLLIIGEYSTRKTHVSQNSNCLAFILSPSWKWLQECLVRARPYKLAVLFTFHQGLRTGHFLLTGCEKEPGSLLNRG